ncbi:hypothetical protein [Denitrobaculum tricleocarpae]|uniref:Uncharacterized protein n=1 Tax=Denitrobaculum tricleocarpae TaxID=2591009 RepID=A0A545TT64_9PROT|nr:hypothetical protein [Denitrobaculum tricleocarpae]TQV80331.1 hypothetical protein FKG95_09050 [Denitrobaculum tricleocarpae]
MGFEAFSAAWWVIARECRSSHPPAHCSDNKAFVAEVRRRAGMEEKMESEKHLRRMLADPPKPRPEMQKITDDAIREIGEAFEPAPTPAGVSKLSPVDATLDTPPTPADIWKGHAQIWREELEATLSGLTEIPLRTEFSHAHIRFCERMVERYESKAAQETE